MHYAVLSIMVVNHLLLITALQMSHRLREGSSSLFLAPYIGPIRDFSLCAYLSPLISGPPQKMKQAFWGGPQSLDLLLSFLAWCWQLPVLVCVIHANIHTAAIWVWRPLSAGPWCPLSFDKHYYAPFHITVAQAARVYHHVFPEHMDHLATIQYLNSCNEHSPLIKVNLCVISTLSHYSQNSEFDVMKLIYIYQELFSWWEFSVF